MGDAVSLQRPDLHLAEALSAELGLAAQRLLGDERVGAGGAGMYLVLYQVHQLHHVDVADRYRLVERFAAAAVEEYLLAVGRRGCALLKGQFLGAQIEIAHGLLAYSLLTLLLQPKLQGGAFGLAQKVLIKHH